MVFVVLPFYRCFKNKGFRRFADQEQSMASPAQDDGGDAVPVVLTCIDRHELVEYNPTQDNDEVVISTTDVHSWNIPSILQHRIIKVKAHRNRLTEYSSYFRGLLGGNFSDPDLEVLVQWNQPTFLSLLASLFGSPVDVTSENFLSLFEGALYFGMEMILSKCKMWLTKAMSVNRAPLVQVNDLIGIWEFGSEIVNNYLPELCTSYLAKNFIWAMSCSSFGDVPQDLLLSSIQHPHLTVDSEEHLCGALLAWIAANKERCTEDVSIDLLKQIRISLLPLWFVAGKSTYQSLSMCSNASSCRSITILKQPSTYYMDALRDGDLHNLRIRLTEFTQRMDLSGCPQIKPAIILLSVLPCPLSLEPLLRKKIKQLVINHELLNGNAFKISWEMWPNLIFEAVQEIDISNCPMLPLEVAVECFSMSFPSLRTLKAANHLSFSTTKVLQLVKRCPLLCDIDLTVDVSPVIPTRMSILSSFPATQTSSASFDLTGSPLPGSRSYMSRPLLSNITKLTLEGRIDVCDFDLQTISNICVSLTYLSLKGCTSLSDVGMSALICKCLKLNSIVACDTFFGQQSILALFSLNNCYDRVAAKHSEKNILPACNLQMLHMGGCKGINMTTFSELMFQAYMLKSLCLRETQVLDDGLFSFFGSSLEVLDVSNTKVISDHLIVNLLESLTHLKSFALCHCLGETSSLSFKVSMPNLRKLRLERVAPWMSNADLVSLSRNCANLIELSLLGCRLLNSESQKIISSCWPGLISIHLEECGDVTSDGVVSLFDCHAIEDILLRHNGSGIQKDFIGNAVKKLPMLRKISLDICDAKDKDFDIPELDDRHFLSHVKIARCKSQGCNFNLQHVRASRSPVHTETLVLVWDSKQLTRTIIKERV
ncbi:BTB/POZ domain-containing protein FBL11 isoform X3 [Cynara cardunculus var. scolymus]|uniref:BTB/POZ domain-containing protein FBL11 isoform X3 n=1 Tax=Cynara cardunculus var. scolymus TaxID=59895 RepID=UPI000D62D243|nr:BTB/POZ domain-containing protein FBL11 isoform X3 [Cynara cardunculus var. scolymus]